ncbi:AAA domain-containing protein [Flavobacterium gillisiae]|uniref:AAA domain-containing protein n=1 Tax=Flavobacterium gillisiae TaxID=150146 RepID=A0A1H4FW34_9FLAO|nr:AAA domain-containing protein [Flavobacterium gillisiae]SEB01526.1 AAA domain-containing protein [Flavobacterium gillisiae]
MNNKSLAIIYIEELSEIHFDNILTIPEKYKKLRDLLEKITKELTKNEVVNFSNLFSRLTFIVDKYQTKRNIHRFRGTANEVVYKQKMVSYEEYNTHFKYIAEFIAKVFNYSIPQLIQNEFPIEEFKPVYDKKSGKIVSELRAEIIEIQDRFLICDFENNQDDNFIKVSINDVTHNSLFTSVNDFWKHAQVNLVNVIIDENGIYFPKIIILEPDYLVDVSAIAECFQDYGTSALNYIKSKFEETPNNKHIRLGNFANLVMDKMFAKQDDEILEFKDVIKEDFRQYPIEYATCNDIEATADMQEYVRNCQTQFSNINKVVVNDFSREPVSIDIKKATLEPTFLNKRYGIQGRLDVLQNIEKQKGKSKIIELKSGSPPFPDDGVSMKPNHATQLYLYYQLIGYINQLDFNEINGKIEGHILYSKLPNNNIRSDKPYLKRIQEIFNLRNEIVLNEFLLSKDDMSITSEIIENITPENIIKYKIYPAFKALLEPQILKLNFVLQNCSKLEKAYFFSFFSFVAKEQYLAKLGNGQSDNSNGLANLWLNQFTEKAERFEILYDLKIIENLANQKAVEITFTRTNEANKFVNFRKGDICVLYPRVVEEDIATDNQIFKCTIKNITTTEVTVGFRNKQNNTIFFKKYSTWAIERDFMDSSFTAMYRNLFSFIDANTIKKNIILGIEQPKIVQDYSFNKKHLSDEQNRIISKALSADDYFLLNGPPGTGKTSIIIKELVKEIITNSESTTLLLAYTNRAVDEICEAVSEATAEIAHDVLIDNINTSFIRIGSELSCNEKFKRNLINNVCSNAQNRNEVRQILTSKRIYIATVASMSSKSELFKLINFDRVIIDEASQILEPQIIGILTKVKRFIMIGDHKQLPAIVLQDPLSSSTKNESLEKIGLANRKNSLFERLYKYCEQNKIECAYDILTYQGRMHKEIALFPNHIFYNSLLNQAFDIPNLKDSSKVNLMRQVLDLDLNSKTKNTLEDLLTKKRMIFFPSKVDDKNHFSKSNEYEARLVVKIVKQIIEIYNNNQLEFYHSKTIGIIATYRNQIAIIKQQLEEAKIPNFEDITVDTVERFQGSQRDIIIVSFAVNNHYQLNGIVNLNDEGDVDRKLNVALTRAKEQLIVIGNDDILSTNLIYYKLIEFIKSKGGYVWDNIEDVLADSLKFDYFESDIIIAGKIFILDNDFKTMFDDIIINPLKFDKRTIKYPELILGKSNDFIRSNIIEYGRANFDTSYTYQTNLFTQEFSIKDKVMLYCFYNMRKHYFSNISVFDSYFDLFKLELKQNSNRITFIDFGCGPLTAGIAFNQFGKKIVENFNMNYFGIDISSGMVEMAKEFSKENIFHNNSTFHFNKSYTEINEELLEELFTLPNLVILNFSYLFANLDLEQTIELAQQINNTVDKFPLNKYIVIYQNPVQRHHNFTRFKKELKEINKNNIRKTETVSYRNKENSSYDNSETFTYEIITN